MQKMGIISSTNTLRPDGKHVRAVRDTIVEVDENMVMLLMIGDCMRF
nr:hypothetical protein [Campylobacter jejuni]